MDPIDDKKYGKDPLASGSDVEISTVRQRQGLYDPSQEKKLTRWGLNAESFKRAPGSTGGHVIHGKEHADMERAGDNVMLQQQMKNRHLQMIAVGGSIGTGLFIGSGGALRRGGPAALVIDWTIMGIMLLNTCQAMGEMAIMYPVSGGFYVLVSRFIDPSWGFAMGWNYVFQWATVLPLELVAAAITMNFWDRDQTVPIAVYITIFFLLILLINVFGTLGFAEEEFWSSCLKLTIIIIFLVSGFVFVLGGGPSDGLYSEYWGARNYYDPGAFANGFKGVCAVFVTAAFSFAGTELVGLAATEHPNPRKALPSAIKMTFWRITFIFILSLLFVGLLVRSDNPRLLGASSYDANASPFVIAFVDAGVPGLPHIVNATITVSVLSIGLSCVYAGSRTLMALAEQGYAPRVFTYVDKAGRPLWAVCAILAFFPIAYSQTNPEIGGQVFDWLLALSGLSTIFTWLSINVAHIRFRMAWKAQGHHVDELPFRAFGGIWGSAFAAGILILVLIAQFYIAIFPIGGTEGPGDAAQSFFLAYLAFPILIFFYIIGFLWKRQGPKRASEIDLVTGRKCFETAEELNAWRARTKDWPMWKRIVQKLFG